HTSNEWPHQSITRAQQHLGSRFDKVTFGTWPKERIDEKAAARSNCGLAVEHNWKYSIFRQFINLFATDIGTGDDDGRGLQLLQCGLGFVAISVVAERIVCWSPFVSGALNRCRQRSRLNLAEEMGASAAALEGRRKSKALIKRFVALRWNCIATKQNRGTVHIGFLKDMGSNPLRTW